MCERQNLSRDAFELVQSGCLHVWNPQNVDGGVTSGLPHFEPFAPKNSHSSFLALRRQARRRQRPHDGQQTSDVPRACGWRLRVYADERQAPGVAKLTHPAASCRTALTRRACVRGKRGFWSPSSCHSPAWGMCGWDSTSPGSRCCTAGLFRSSAGWHSTTGAVGIAHVYTGAAWPGHSAARGAGAGEGDGEGEGEDCNQGRPGFQGDATSNLATARATTKLRGQRWQK